jgi:transposase InsO family protein
VDIYTRESLAIEAGQSLKGEDVVRILNRLMQERGAPKVLFCDNGSEFTGQMMDMWAYRNDVKIDFSRPGKPTDNAFCESFNGTFRAECLDTNWFQSLPEAKQVIEAWRPIKSVLGNVSFSPHQRFRSDSLAVAPLAVRQDIMPVLRSRPRVPGFGTSH